MNIHAAAIVLGSTGVMIKGVSGSGKTSLALAAIKAVTSQNGFAALVADDQCLVENIHGRLIATCPAKLAGLAEMRGHGIITSVFLSPAVIDFVIQLVHPDTIERMPTVQTVLIAGAQLPVFHLPECQIVTSLPILLQILEQHRL